MHRAPGHTLIELADGDVAERRLDLGRCRKAMLVETQCPVHFDLRPSGLICRGR
jgi:hypothetical protein